MYSKSQLIKFIWYAVRYIKIIEKIYENVFEVTGQKIETRPDEIFKIMKQVFTIRERGFLQEYIESKQYWFDMMAKVYWYYLTIDTIDKLRDLIYMPQEPFVLKYWTLLSHDQDVQKPKKNISRKSVSDS